METTHADSAGRVARLWRRVRFGAAIFCVAEFWLYSVLLDDPPLPLLPLGLLIGATLIAVNTFAVRFEANNPRPPEPTTGPLRRDLALLGVDAVLVSGIVLIYSFDPGSTWVLLVIPVLEAGLLGRMRLVLWIWAGSVGVLVADALIAALAFDAEAGALDIATSVAFRSGVLLLVALVVGVAASITHDYVVLLRGAGDRLKHQATHDDLTDLPSRRLFIDRARAALGDDEQNGSVAMSFIDCDRFKAVNDRYGHAAGDAVLAQLAVRLRAAVRAGDTVGRLGGDEFAALMPGRTRAEAEKWTRDIRRALKEPYEIPGDHPPIVVTSTVGLAVADACGPDGDESVLSDLLARADADMYARKESARASRRRSDTRSRTSVAG